VAEVGESVELGALTTLKVGGPAERLVKVDRTDELIRLVRAADADREPLFFLAGGSNVVISDEGVPGTTILIRTRGIEEQVREDGRVALTAAAGEDWDRLVARAVESGLAGIECLSGVPGSVGATPIQNVGAYGQEVADTVEAVLALDRERGELVELPASACGFSYRRSRFKGDDRFLIIAVTFLLDPSPRSTPVRYAQLAAELGIEVGERVPLEVARETVLALRRRKSMVIDPDDPDSVSAGSFFTNPVLPGAEMEALAERAAALTGPDDPPPAWPAGDGMVKTSAAWLIDRSGFGPGYGEGPVGLSRNHTLALVNRGGARAGDVVAFAREISSGVERVFGIELTPEPVFVGHGW